MLSRIKYQITVCVYLRENWKLHQLNLLTGSLIKNLALMYFSQLDFLTFHQDGQDVGAEIPLHRINCFCFIQMSINSRFYNTHQLKGMVWFQICLTMEITPDTIAEMHVGGLFEVLSNMPEKLEIIRFSRKKSICCFCPMIW